MNDKNIAIVSCTALKNKEDTLLYQSLTELEDAGCETFDDVTFITNNQKGLSYRYNEYLNQYGQKYDYIVFAHDDVFISDGMIISKLIKAHCDYDIVGVAGGINPTISSPSLWHLMCGGFGTNLRGFAGHFISDQQVNITNFGPTPARVAIADGLFLSIDVKKITEKKWKFNENYTFHLYDIASCIDANKAKLKIGVYPILLFHASPGLKTLSDPVFLHNQNKFLAEYSSN